jgi:hypothetical protein
MSSGKRVAARSTKAAEKGGVIGLKFACLDGADA